VLGGRGYKRKKYLRWTSKRVRYKEVEGGKDEKLNKNENKASGKKRESVQQK